MTTEEIIQDRRFRRAIMSGEYYRSVTVFLRLKFPEREDLSTLPKDELIGAQVAVDNALFGKRKIEKELEEEMV